MAELSNDYLQNELQRLDLLIHREILRLRAAYQLSLDEFRGLYVSDQQVDALLCDNHELPLSMHPAELTSRAAELHHESQHLLEEESHWPALRREFDLSPADMDLLVLALALETHPKYETLFAYLNNDVTRKWPTCDLALRVFAEDAEAKMEYRRALLPHMPLLSSGLLRPIAGTERGATLSCGFTLAPEACRYLMRFPPVLGKAAEFLTRVEPHSGWDQFSAASALRLQLESVPDILLKAGGSRPLIVFVTRYGMGAEKISQAICTQLQCPLLFFRAEMARITDEPFRKIAQSVLLQTRLDGAGLHVSEWGGLFGPEGHATSEAHLLISSLAEIRQPVFMSFDPHVRWRELLQGKRTIIFTLEEPDFDERRRLWQELGQDAISDSLAGDLADRFVLGPDQIRDAIVMARDHHSLRHGHNGCLDGDDLLEGARAQSDQNLGKLASRLRGAHTWNDLVLPPATLRQIKEISAAIRFRHQVYSTWGFERRLVSGKGLKVLFSGSAGTGKTMTAGIIARDLGLDLYKIDLSGIVSKFIGETEKNLDRIFRAAQSGNAILFFDEADALFGKRSEVKDAHDRYANIEVAYLLQKMEDHDGVVILATNLSKNMDDAFSRRVHYAVEFPLPNAMHRERLWRGMFPPQAPLDEDVDFKFLAEQFPLPGGDIRNIVLSAAFLAAQDGSAIHMRHLVPALGRLMVKKGKVPTATEFKQYHSWLTASE